MTGRRSHGRLSALNGVVHQGRIIAIVMSIAALLSALLLRLGTLKVAGIWGETPLGTLLAGLGVVEMGILLRYEQQLAGVELVVSVVVTLLFIIGLKIEASARKARVQS